MFRFRGYLGRKHFAWGAAIRLLLMTVGTVGFPYIIWIVGQVTGCARVGGACGAVALMTSFFVKPVIAVLFVFSFFGICLRRARDAGLPAWIGAVVPLLLLRDAGALIFAGAHWSFAFSTGYLGMGRVGPIYAALSLVCILALCWLPSRDAAPPTPGKSAKLGPIFGTAVVVAAVVLAFVPIVSLMPPLARYAQNTLTLTASLGSLQSTITIVITLVFAWFAWQCLTVPAPAPLRLAPIVPAGQRGPAFAMAVLATAMTLVAFLLGPSPPLRGIPFFSDTLLLTFALYFIPLIAGYLVVTSPGRRSLALLALALLPFVQFTYAYWSTAQQRAAEAAELAAIPIVRADEMPTTILLQQLHGLRADELLAINGIERVVWGGATGRAGRMVQYERRAGQPPQRTDIDGLPPRYLHLRVGPSSSFRKQVLSAARAESGGPFELRLVGEGRDDLVGLWFRTYTPMPTLPPLLSTAGWHRGQPRGSAAAPHTPLLRFLASSLASAS